MMKYTLLVALLGTLAGCSAEDNAKLQCDGVRPYEECMKNVACKMRPSDYESYDFFKDECDYWTKEAREHKNENYFRPL